MEGKQFKKLSFSFLPIPEELMKSKALSFGAKFLFGIIAKANKESVKWSVKYLSERMGCTSRETRRRIVELKENNLIGIIPREGRVNEYFVNLELIQTIQTPDQMDTPDQTSQGRDDHNGQPYIKKINKDIINKNFDYAKEKERLLKKMEMVDSRVRTEVQEISAKEERKIKAGKIHE